MTQPTSKGTPDRRLSEIEASLTSLDRQAKEQRLSVFGIEQDIEIIRKLVESLDTKYARLLELAEVNATDVKANRQERATHQHALDRHETRLKKLEKKIA